MSLKRSTVYFDPQIHAALRLKAAQSERSISEIVNDAVKLFLGEDQEDLAAFKERADEPIIDYETFLNELKANDKI